MINKQLRVGVLFGGRSSEHEVSLASARNVIDALQKAGHIVVPLGITPQGRWLTTGDPLALLTGATTTNHTASLMVNGQNGTHEANKAWALLPQASKEAPLPASFLSAKSRRNDPPRNPFEGEKALRSTRTVRTAKRSKRA